MVTQSIILAIACPITGGTYITYDFVSAIAAALLTVHRDAKRAPKIQRHSLIKGLTEENWNSLTFRSNIFKQETALAANEVCQQLFSCCDDDLGNFKLLY